mgnify:CR=1 FL=1
MGLRLLRVGLLRRGGVGLLPGGRGGGRRWRGLRLGLPASGALPPGFPAVVIEGEPAGGTQVAQDLNEVEVEADALNIPENIVFNVHNLEAGTQITAGQLEVPAGATVVTDADALVINITEIAAAQTDEDEAEAADEAAE